jgi:hypothetical protein
MPHRGNKELALNCSVQPFWMIIEQLAAQSGKHFSVVDVAENKFAVIFSDSVDSKCYYQVSGPFLLKISKLNHFSPPDFKIQIEFKIYGDVYLLVAEVRQLQCVSFAFTRAASLVESAEKAA